MINPTAVHQLAELTNKRWCWVLVVAGQGEKQRLGV